MKKVFFLLFGWLTIPHVFMYLLSRNKQTINKDVERWSKCAQIRPIGGGQFPYNQHDVAFALYQGI